MLPLYCRIFRPRLRQEHHYPRTAPFGPPAPRLKSAHSVCQHGTRRVHPHGGRAQQRFHVPAYIARAGHHPPPLSSSRARFSSEGLVGQPGAVGGPKLSRSTTLQSLKAQCPLRIPYAAWAHAENLVSLSRGFEPKPGRNNTS